MDTNSWYNLFSALSQQQTTGILITCLLPFAYLCNVISFTPPSTFYWVPLVAGQLWVIVRMVYRLTTCLALLLRSFVSSRWLKCSQRRGFLRCFIISKIWDVHSNFIVIYLNDMDEIHGTFVGVDLPVFAPKIMSTNVISVINKSAKTKQTIPQWYPHNIHWPYNGYLEEHAWDTRGHFYLHGLT